MSASLVGSEMCIRDRSKRSRAIMSLIGRAPPSPRTPPDKCLRRARRPGSVSYTHLTLPTICSV
eukprot:6452895-Alexandrium_andersonii.AAC.1